MERQISAYTLNKGKLLNLFVLGRTWNGASVALIAIFGYLFNVGAYNLFVILSLFASFLLVFMAGTILNDISGFKIDQINMPYRPLQQNKVSLIEAKVFTILLSISSLFIALFTNIYLLLGIIIIIIIAVLYSSPPFNIEKRGIYANILLAIVTIFVPAMTGAMIGLNSLNVSTNFLYAVISMTVLYVGISIIKDFKDVTGDTKYNKRTFVIAAGRKNALITTVAITAIFFPLTTYFFAELLKRHIFFYVISAVLFLALIKVEIEKQALQDQKTEEDRFMKARLVMLLYILTLLLFVLYTR